MSHMVIYRTPDGKAAFQQVDDLPAAVAFVEKIRNEAGVENGRIYRLEQINYRFEPYYQVRIDTGEAPSTAPPPASAAGGGPLATGAPTAPAAEPAGGAGQGQAAVPGSAPAPAGVSVASAAAEPGTASAAAGTTDESSGDAGNGVRRGLFGR